MRVNISNETDHLDFIQIDGPDIWAMNYTLSRLILPMLLLLRERKHGVPIECMPDRDWRQQVFDFIDDEKEHDVALDIGEKRWNVIMDEMIWSFTEVESQRWNDPSYGMKYPGGLQAYNARVQIGLSHFGKHYTNLWD